MKHTPSGSSGADTALSNLASVAINTSLISDTDNTDDLGSSSKTWRAGYFKTLTINSTAITATVNIEATASNLRVLSRAFTAYDGTTFGAVLQATTSGIYGGVSAGLTLASGNLVAWDSTTSAVTGTPDTFLSRSAAGIVKIGGATAAGTKIAEATVLLSAVTGATVTATNLIPAKAKVVGVSTRVTTGLGVTSGTTGYAVGTAGDPNQWGDVVGTIAGTDTDNTDATADPTLAWNAATQDVVITAAGGNFDGTGAIRVCVQYLSNGAPTS